MEDKRKAVIEELRRTESEYHATLHKAVDVCHGLSKMSCCIHLTHVNTRFFSQHRARQQVLHVSHRQMSFACVRSRLKAAEADPPPPLVHTYTNNRSMRSR